MDELLLVFKAVIVVGMQGAAHATEDRTFADYQLVNILGDPTGSSLDPQAVMFIYR